MEAARLAAITIAARQLYEQQGEWQKRWDQLLPAIQGLWIDRIKQVVQSYENALGLKPTLH